LLARDVVAGERADADDAVGGDADHQHVGHTVELDQDQRRLADAQVAEGAPRLGLERAGDGHHVQVGVHAAVVVAQDADTDVAGLGVGFDQAGGALGGLEIGASDAQADGRFKVLAQALDVEFAGESPELGDVADHPDRVRPGGRTLTRSMQRFVVRLLITSLAVLLASYLVPDMIQVDSFAAALIFALVLGILNAFLRPILLLLTLPLTILTLGLFTLVVNAVVFWLAAQLPVGVHVFGFGAAFVAAFIVSIVSFLASRALT
jgi:putative membrane protein